MLYQPNTVLFSAGYDEVVTLESRLAEAKEYIKQHGLTADDVRIVNQKEKQILNVITKRAVDLK